MNQQNKKFKEKLKNLPKTPGIYLMKDSHQDVLYVGKAKNLKQRVSSYFQNNSQHSNKVRRMVFNLADFEIIEVDTELDALLLECELIQQHHPLYNRQMNQFAQYCYINIDEQGITSSTLDGELGPYRAYRKIPEIIRQLSELYQLSTINHITKLSLEKQLPEMKHYPLPEKSNEIRGFFEGRDDSYHYWMNQRIAYCIEERYFEHAQKLSEELQFLTTFYNQIRELHHFINQKENQFILPISASEKKVYQLAYGKVVYSKIIPYTETFQPISLTPNQTALGKSEIDPTLILLHYIKKMSEKG